MKHVSKLSVTDVQNFKTMMHELKEAFHKKHDEAKGSRERMKHLAAKCVQAYNEAEKRKALGRPGIDPKRFPGRRRSLLWTKLKHPGVKNLALSSPPV